VNGPILRATDATGEVYDDPSEDALFMFMEDLRSLQSDYLRAVSSVRSRFGSSREIR
jgi:hypothetical protein